MEKLYKVIAGLVVVSCILSSATLLVLFTKEKNLGTEMTLQTSNGKYTEGADLYQNVQAIAERMAGLTQGQILQADSAGRMQAISGSAFYGGLELSGAFSAGGASLDITEVYPTSTLSAANFCDYSYAYYSATSTALDLQLPTAAQLAADCLRSVGMSHSILLYNASTTAAMTNIIAGANMDLIGSPTTTAGQVDSWDGGDYRLLTVLRDATGNVKALLTGFNDAD